MTRLNRETGRDRYFAARQRELEELIDPATGRVDERYARWVPCPVCGSDRHDPLFEKNGFTFVRCIRCALVFSNPQVTNEVTESEYRSGGSNDLWVDVLTSERQLELDRAKFAEILEELEPYRGEGRLLDVGCSIGLFLHLALERGWAGIGTEYGERALRYARERFGLDVTDKPLHEAGFESESFDVVTLLSVLEHVADPRAMLAEIRGLLKPGGALFLIVPNVASLACRVLHEHAATFDGRNHLIYFSPATLRDTLEREGFSTEIVRTRVSSLDAISEWLAFHEPYSDADVSHDRLAQLLTERRDELERLVVELDLGYKTHCLATKR